MPPPSEVEQKITKALENGSFITFVNVDAGMLTETEWISISNNMNVTNTLIMFASDHYKKHGPLSCQRWLIALQKRTRKTRNGLLTAIIDIIQALIYIMEGQVGLETHPSWAISAFGGADMYNNVNSLINIMSNTDYLKCNRIAAFRCLAGHMMHADALKYIMTFGDLKVVNNTPQAAEAGIWLSTLFCFVIELFSP